MDIKEIYELNKELDKEFLNRYENIEDLVNKNILSLIVEVGELANETKVFKYWSVKKPDIEDVLEEYVDVLTMILTFMNYFNLEATPFQYKEVENPTLQFLKLYEKVSTFYKNYNAETVIEIYELVKELSYSLNLNTCDIIEAAKLKINKVYKRLESDY
jgi:dimeric dUTPase (all-alpha-NTP-PPase superfamily)